MRFEAVDMAKVRLTLLFDMIWQINDKTPKNRGYGPIFWPKIFLTTMQSVNLTSWVSEPCPDLIS